MTSTEIAVPRVSVSVNNDLSEVQVSLMGPLLPLTLMGCESELLNNGNGEINYFYNKVLCVTGIEAKPTL